MTDPVTTLDGFTYERAAITEWLRTKVRVRARVTVTVRVRVRVGGLG